MEKTSGDKRKHEGNLEDAAKESKKSKISKPGAEDLPLQEACASNEEATPRSDTGVLAQEAENNESSVACHKEDSKTEILKSSAECTIQNEDNPKNLDYGDGSIVNEKSERSAEDSIDCEKVSDKKKEDSTDVHSDDDDDEEALDRIRDANKSFKRPRSTVSPSSPDDSVSERASCSPNSEEPLRCGKKLKIDEVEEENVLPSCSPEKDDTTECDQTKEIETVQYHQNEESLLNDLADSPDNSYVKELNVVEFCRLTSVEHTSVLNGNDVTSEQSLAKESLCDGPVFGVMGESLPENNLDNNTFNTERDVFVDVEQQEAVQEFPRRRRRKKHIINALQKLLEFYLSRANVTKDKFLQQKMSADGYVELTVFLEFNKVKCLTDELKLLKYAAKNSSLLELSYDETRVKLKLGYPEKEDESDCTVYVDNLPRTVTRDWLCHYFSQFGEVEYVSLPLFKDSKRSRGFAFVEFSEPASAQLAVDAHEGRQPMANCGQGLSQLNSSEKLTNSQACFTKYELLSAVPDSSSQCEDENASRTESDQVSAGDILTDSTVTTTTTPTTAAAATAGSEAECTSSPMKGSSDISNDNNVSRNIDDDFPRDDNRASRSRESEVINEQLLFVEENENLSLPKRMNKNSRLKRCMGKEKLVGPGLIDQFLVIPKRVWFERRQAYLSEQKKRLGMCKAIMATERLQEEALKIEFDGPRPPKQMPLKSPGLVVKVTLEQPVVDKASLITGVMSMGGAGVQFVDCAEGEKIFHVRFNSRESASAFRYSNAWKSKSSIIEGQEEDEFWDKVQSCWTARITNPRIRKKTRGKDKIANRWRKRREALEGNINDVISDPNADQE